MNRYNLIKCVRAALAARNISVVRVCDAINASLGQLSVKEKSTKLGTGSARMPKKGDWSYTVSYSERHKLVGSLTDPLRFDAWHSKVEGACKVAEIEVIGIPAIFDEWLQKFERTDTVPEGESVAS